MGIYQGDERASASRKDAFGYIPGIDGLRAIAVVSVILYHLNAALLPGGFVGVDIFFVISGFVVTGSLMGMRFDRVRDLLAYFYARRLVRIMPALIVMLIVTIIFSNLFVPKAWLSKSAASVAFGAFFGVSNVTLGLQTDTYFAPEAAFNPFIHTWSLGVEEQFYLIFPFLFFWYSIARLRPQGYPGAVAAIALVSILSLAICAWFMKTEPRYAFYMIPARFWELGVGMLLCLTRDRWIPMLDGMSRITTALFGALSLALILYAFTIHEVDGFPFPFAIPPVLGTAGLIMAVCAWRGSVVSRLLSSRPFVTVGKLSYSLYLWHWPVFVLFRWTIGLETPVTAIVALALVLVLGWASYAFIEKPTRYNLHLKTLSRPAVIGLSLAVVALSSGAGATLLRGQSLMSLSRTANTPVWYADGRKPLWRAASCELESKDEAVDRGKVTTWTPRNCKAAAKAPRIVTIGDSHGLAYSPMLRQYAAETGREVQLWYASGCGFMHLIVPIASHEQCDSYYGAMLTRLRRELRPGDILFLPNLRLKRFADQSGIAMGSGVEPVAGLPDSEDERRALAVAEAVKILAELRKTGATIMFEAPLPLFRAAPFRCSDWFNRSNPMCTSGLSLTRAEFEEMRSPILEAMAVIGRQVDGITIWDPAHKLCSPITCRAMRQDKPLFFDGDHLSGYGNEVLYPHFRDYIHQRTASAN